MNLHVEYSRFVRDDVDEIWSCIAERNPDAAERLVTDLAERFKMLGQNPLLGFARADLIVGLRQFPHKKYNIYYFPTENGIEVYRVLHSARDEIQIFEHQID